MTPIQPALTPEQWADLFANPYDWEQYDHGAAAIALHGQPYGFAQADVEFLRDIAQDLNAIQAETLANRIAALLPPTP